MAVTPAKRYKGTALLCTWTQTFPASSAAITLDGMKSVKFDAGISQKTEAADGDGFMSVQFMDLQNPTVSLETINPYATAAMTGDQRGTLAYKVADVNGGVAVAGGGKSYSITNSFLMGVNIDHTFREYGKASVTFGMIAPDGTTSPVTVTGL